MSRRLPYMPVDRSYRAKFNETYILRECRKIWEPSSLSLPEEVRALSEVFDGVKELQTFLPYPDFVQTMRCLDPVRLCKQRVEAYLILQAIHGHYPLGDDFRGHPVVAMWTGHYSWLQRYYNEAVREWVLRGGYTEMGTVRPYHDTTIIDEASFFVSNLDSAGYPPWLGAVQVHASHRAALLAKDPTHYSQFGWTETPEINYYWPAP